MHTFTQLTPPGTSKTCEFTSNDCDILGEEKYRSSSTGQEIFTNLMRNHSSLSETGFASGSIS